MDNEVEDYNRVQFYRCASIILSCGVTDREFKVLMWRFFNNKTYSEIAWLDCHSKPVSRERVRQVTQKALLKIKNKNNFVFDK